MWKSVGSPVIRKSPTWPLPDQHLGAGPGRRAPAPRRGPPAARRWRRSRRAQVLDGVHHRRQARPSCRRRRGRTARPPSSRGSNCRSSPGTTSTWPCSSMPRLPTTRPARPARSARPCGPAPVVPLAPETPRLEPAVDKVHRGLRHAQACMTGNARAAASARVPPRCLPLPPVHAPVPVSQSWCSTPAGDLRPGSLHPIRTRRCLPMRSGGSTRAKNSGGATRRALREPPGCPPGRPSGGRRARPRRQRWPRDR